MSKAKNDDNNFDDLFTRNDDSNADDLFLSDPGSGSASSLDAGSGTGVDFDSISGISSVDDALDLSGMSNVEVGVEGSSEFSFSDLSAFSAAPDLNEAAPQTDKKAKSSKSARRVKAVPKEKVKKAKPVDDGVRYGSAKPFFVLGALFLLLIVAGDIAALLVAGGGAIVFLVYFNVLGVALLSVPYCLIRQLRSRPVSLFDMALAIAAAAVVVGCMAVLAYQAKTYGGSTKATASTIPVVKTLDRC